MLEGVYSELGEAESALVLDASRPLEALDQLVAFTWRYYVEHPEFVALLSNENLQRGRHITKSVKVKQLSRPVLDILATILAEGERQQVFRRGLDVQEGLPDARRARILLSLQPLHAVELSRHRPDAAGRMRSLAGGDPARDARPRSALPHGSRDE